MMTELFLSPGFQIFLAFAGASLLIYVMSKI